MKRCSKCGVEKPRAEFSRNRRTKDGFCYKCKACFAAYRLENRKELAAKKKVNYQENKEEILAKKKVQYQGNQEKRIAKQKVYDLEHKEEKAAYNRGHSEEINARRRERGQTDPNYMFAVFCRNQVTRMLNGNSKSHSSDEYLGCTKEQGRKYIESLWEPGMTWENRGEWDIHHILPLHTFDANAPESIFKACHYTNLQPLWEADHNRVHGAKVN